MNEYPSELQSLDRDLLGVVVQYDLGYQIYVDALALMHDLVCEFADSPEKPRLTPTEIDTHQDEVVRKLRTSGLSVIQREALVENIETNYRLAWKIRNSAERSESTEERFQAELRATQFLNSLVQTYTTLRVLKQNREPAHL